MSTQKTGSVLRHGPVARAAGIISIGTLSSRLLGFIRDMLIARIFGITLAAQAFVVALRIPNLFRDILAEGAANAAFVPVFSAYAARRSKEEFWELVNVLLNLLLVVLALVVLAGVVCAPLIVRAIAPGFTESPQVLSLTISLTRVMFPYLFLVSLAAYVMGILNALKNFSVSAFASCFLNLAVIAALLLFGDDVRALAYGVLTGGLLQLAIQLPTLRRKGFRVGSSFMRRFRHPEAAVVGRLLLPRIVSSALYQLNAFVDTIFGSLAWIVGSGGVAVLYYAYRLILFPLGLFSSSLAQAVLPSFSEHAAAAERGRLGEDLAWALRMTFFLLVPAAVGLAVLALPVVQTIFGGGQFDSATARATAAVVLFYSIGLPAFGANKILQSCFFALKDTATPARVAAAALVSNVLLNLLLIYPLKIAGIALATSLSAFLSLSLLVLFLRRRLGALYEREVLRSLARIIIASSGMGAVCWYFRAGWPGAGSSVHQAVNLAAIALTGLAVYAALCSLLGIHEFEDLFRLLRRRHGHG